jgi:hypothetical protein
LEAKWTLTLPTPDTLGERCHDGIKDASIDTISIIYYVAPKMKILTQSEHDGDEERSIGAGKCPFRNTHGRIQQRNN